MERYILTLDQGTTSSRALLVSAKGEVVGKAQKEFEQHFPKQGWVEHDADEIWTSQKEVMLQVLKENAVSPSAIAAIGITNQRETTIAWNRETGKPLGNAIVWQDKRTAKICDQLRKNGHAEYIRSTTGLIVDAYFSASKMTWILQNYPEAEQLMQQGNLCMGTVDSWLIWNLTEGEAFVTDASNASRTMLFDIHQMKWDQTLLELFGVSASALPEVKSSVDSFGTAKVGNVTIPITGVAGDQQAALFGQGCLQKGMVKNTYGTGCFMLMNTGNQAGNSAHGLISTIAWSMNGEVTYALEGSVFIAGAAIQWLRDGLRVIDEAPDSEYFAEQADNEEPVYVVPAFVGLGAPHWDMYARGAIFGLTRDTGKPEIVRATLESMAFQTRDVLDAMASDAAIPIHSLRVDGGASANNFLMQFQADVIQTNVNRPSNVESTALGAAFLAGIGVGMWTTADVGKFRSTDKIFQPRRTSAEIDRLYKGWKKAVNRTLGWLENEEE
ncbi:MAG: glycerol kinase GlpK [Flavobacteriales bacterium]|nr:glycerol kinase GlpK [Flavobacteriales bacterium]